MPVESELLLAARGGVLTFWLLLIGSLFALAFPSTVAAGDFLFTIDEGVVRLMAAALALASAVLLADYYGLIDVVEAVGP